MLVATAVHDRQQPPGIGGGVLDVADARMRREPLDHIQRQVRALELRIGVDHDGDIDRIGNGTEVGFDLRLGERKIGFEDRQDTVGAALLIGFCLHDCVRGRCRGDAGNDGHAAIGGLDGRLHHGGALRIVEIGEFAGRAERRQAVHAGLDQVIAKGAQHAVADVAGGIDRGNQIGKDAVEISHARISWTVRHSRDRARREAASRHRGSARQRRGVARRDVRPARAAQHLWRHKARRRSTLPPLQF